MFLFVKERNDSTERSHGGCVSLKVSEHKQLRSNKPDGGPCRVDHAFVGMGSFYVCLSD